MKFLPSKNLYFSEGRKTNKIHKWMVEETAKYVPLDIRSEAGLQI